MCYKLLHPKMLKKSLRNINAWLLLFRNIMLFYLFVECIFKYDETLQNLNPRLQTQMQLKIPLP